MGNAGTVLASKTQNAALNGTISFNLTRAGTCSLRVGTSGYGASSSSGFSDFGGRGLYRLTARHAAPIAAPQPKS